MGDLMMWLTWGQAMWCDEGSWQLAGDSAFHAYLHAAGNLESTPTFLPDFGDLHPHLQQVSQQLDGGLPQFQCAHLQNVSEVTETPGHSLSESWQAEL